MIAPAAEDHLPARPHRRPLAVPGDLDPDRPLPVEQDAGGERVGQDGQVRPGARRGEERPGGARAASVLHGELAIGEAVLGSAVHVRVVRVAALLRRVEERVADRMGLGLVGDVERPADPVVLVRAPRLVLGTLEVREHVVEGPAPVPELGPDVVVAGMPPDVEHPVDGARPPEDLAARDRDRPVPGLLVRLGMEEPVHGGIVEGLREAHRDVDPRVLVTAARLEQRHPSPGVFGQPGGEDAAGGAGPHDDVIELHCLQTSLSSGYPRGAPVRDRDGTS